MIIGARNQRSGGPDEALAEFAALRYFALNDTDHRSHGEQNTAIEVNVRWRSTRARSKTGFATDSPIRTWTHYPTKVA